jgi:hypothetical protein
LEHTMHFTVIRMPTSLKIISTQGIFTNHIFWNFRLISPLGLVGHHDVKQILVQLIL